MCLIINIKEFKPSLENGKLEKREGSEFDIERLTKTFKRLEFDVVTCPKPADSNVKQTIECPSSSTTLTKHELEELTYRGIINYLTS